MPTPVSSSTPYATVADLLARYDYTTIGDLLTDGRDRTKPDKGTLTNSGTDENVILLDILRGSSGLVESAALLGGKYTPADLQALTGNQSALLRRIVCDLAIFDLYKRRPNPDAPIPPAYREATTWLSALEDGTAIFGLQEVIDATHMKSTVETPGIVEDRNQWSFQAERFFGRRGNRQ